MQGNNLISTVFYLGITKSLCYHRMKLKQRNVNLKFIRLNCLYHGTAIHYAHVMLSLSDLETALRQKEMMT